MDALFSAVFWMGKVLHYVTESAILYKILWRFARMEVSGRTTFQKGDLLWVTGSIGFA